MDQDAAISQKRVALVRLAVLLDQVVVQTAVAVQQGTSCLKKKKRLRVLLICYVTRYLGKPAHHSMVRTVAAPKGQRALAPQMGVLSLTMSPALTFRTAAVRFDYFDEGGTLIYVADLQYRGTHV